MENYFAAETLIIERLKDQVTDLRVVQGAGSAEEVFKGSRAMPIVHVLHDGDEASEDGSHRAGEDQLVVQRWLIILSVQSHRESADGLAVRKEAGPLLMAITNALQGWKPTTGLTPLIKVSSPAARYQDNHGHFFLAFTTRITHRG
ncbi:MAG: hypothetical protein HQL52_20165 [Magnetococcales bacterium]|nr:hypothetical protein [Magnetococcales bacterium]